MQELENYLNENESILKDIKYQRKTWQLFEDNLQKKSFRVENLLEEARKEVEDLRVIQSNFQIYLLS